MACKIEKVLTPKGEQSQLFNSLVESMGEPAALQEYLAIMSDKEGLIKKYGENLQGEPKVPINETKYKLEGFDTYQDSVDTMDYITQSYIDAFKSLPDVSDPTTISGINFHKLSRTPQAFRQATQLVRKRMQDHMNTDGVTQHQLKLLRQATLNLPMYIHHKDKLGPVGEKLAERGVYLSLSDRKTVVDDMTEANWEESNEDTSIENELSYERIYDLDILNVPTSTSVSDGVNSYLLSKPRVNTHERYLGGNPALEKSVLMADRPAELVNTRANLFTVLKGIQTPSEMIYRIEQALPTMPDLVPIYQDLINEKPIDISGTSQQLLYKPIQSTLFSTFAKQDYDMVTIVEDNGIVKFLESNRNSVKGQIKTKWANQINNIQDALSVAKQQDAKAQRSSEALKKKRVTLNKVKQATDLLKAKSMRDLVDAGDNADSRSFDRMMVNIFKGAGFGTVDRLTLDNIREILVNKPPKNMLDNGRVPSYSNTMINYMTTLVKPVLEGSDVFKDTSAQRAENKLLNFLATSSIGFITDTQVGAYRSSSNDMVHPLNYSSAAQDIISTLKDTRDTELREAFSQDPIYANTEIMKLLEFAPYEEALRMRTLDVLSDNSKFGSGVSYGQMSSLDAIASRINAYGAGENVGKLFNAFSPTQADRGRVTTLVVEKKNTDDKGRDIAVFDYSSGQPKLIDGEIKEWITTQIQSEIARMHAPKDKYKNYNTNGKRFNLFTELNDKVPFAAPTVMLNQAMSFMDGIFHDIVQKDIAYMQDAGLGSMGRASGTLRPSFKLNESQVLNMKDNITLNLRQGNNMHERTIHNFLANNFIYTYEQSIFFSGDLAFYKAEDGGVSKVDLNKRLGLPFTPGVRMAVGAETGIRPISVVKVLNEPKMKSNTAEIYKNLYDDNMFLDENGEVDSKAKKDFYSDIEHADGFGLVSIKRYKESLVARGLHDGELIQYLNRLDNWRPGQAHVRSDRVMEVLKEFAFQLRPDNKGTIAPFNLKYAIMPVVPSFFESVNEIGEYNYSGMAAISKELRSNEKGSADIIVPSTAVKVGAKNMTDIAGLFENVGTKLYNQNVRVPQVSPTIEKVEDRYGSQVRKLIESNSVPEGQVNGMTEAQARDVYQESLDLIIQAKGEEVWNRFIQPDGHINKPALVEEIMKSVMTNNYANVEYFKEALSIDGENTLLPLDYPTIQFRVDNMVNAAFRNNVNKFKIPGHSAVQVSSFGMEASKDGISTASDLAFVTFTDKEGNKVSPAKAITIANRIRNGEDVSGEYNTSPAEIRVTPKFFKNRIKEIARRPTQNMKNKITEAADEIAEFMIEIEAAPEAIREAINMVVEEKKAELIAIKEKQLLRLLTNKDGTFDIEKIRGTGLDKVNLYRIPTQGKNSMLAAVIKDFLPSDLGGTIQVPGEIVEQSGSDFDIDKIWMEALNFDVKFENGKHKIVPHSSLGIIDSQKKAKAYIHDYTHGILTSTNHVQGLLTPNGTRQLSNIANRLGATDNTFSANFGSLTSQDVFRTNNMAGKNLISISSVSSTAHAIAPHIGTHLNQNFKLNRRAMTDFRINGRPVELGSLRSVEGGFISDEIGEIQNASLDNARDPLLGKLNIDELTSSPVLFLLSAGHGLNYSVNVVNSPIVKEVARQYPKYLRKSSPIDALKMAANAAKRKYGVPTGTKGSVTVNHANYTKEIAEGATTDTSPATQAEALQMFLDMKQLGDGLARLQRAMNFDSKGTPASAQGLYMKYLDIAGVKGTDANIREQGDGVAAWLGTGNRKYNEMFSIDNEKYRKHSLSSYEENSIYVPLVASTRISNTLTPYMQKLVSEATYKLGYLTENDMIRLTSDFYSFMSVNSNATQDGTKTQISDLIDTTSPNIVTNMYSLSNTESAALQVENYNEKINRSKIPSNRFVKALTIVKKDGRKFVAFNNSIAQGMTKVAKQDMMYSFELLMNSDDANERKLAKTLTEYALISYGFSSGVNSFMSFVPPTAHAKYLGTSKGNTLSVVDLFRVAKDMFADTSVMATPETFLDLYLSNNAERLVRDRGTYTKMKDLLSADPFTGEIETKPPGYYLVYQKSGVKQLYKYDADMHDYVLMQMRGEPRLATEYYTNPGDASLFHDSANKKAIASVKDKAAATVVNDAIIKNIEAESKVLRDFYAETAPTRIAANISEATVIATGIADRYAHVLQGKGKFIIDNIRRTPEKANKIYQRSKTKGSLGNKVFNDFFTAELQRITMGELLDMSSKRKVLITQIQNCGV